LFEDRGQRKLAVLNASSDSTSVTVLDVTTPSAIRIVSTTPLPRNLFVALNNVPRFSVDGRYVFVGASLSELLFTINVETGTIVGTLERTNAVVPAPFADGPTQMFAVANLGTDPTLSYRLKKSGAPKSVASVVELENGFVLVGNDPIVRSDGSAGYVPNYGRSSLVAFDPRTGALNGELSLGKGPGQIAIDQDSGTVVAIEVNGTASRILIGNLADLAAVPGVAGSTRIRSTRGVHADSTGAVLASEVRRDGTNPPRVATYSLDKRRLLKWNPLSKSKSR
jgi:hypothetical protein